MREAIVVLVGGEISHIDQLSLIRGWLACMDANEVTVFHDGSDEAEITVKLLIEDLDEGIQVHVCEIAGIGRLEFEKCVACKGDKLRIRSLILGTILAERKGVPIILCHSNLTARQIRTNGHPVKRVPLNHPPVTHAL